VDWAQRNGILEIGSGNRNLERNPLKSPKSRTRCGAEISRSTDEKSRNPQIDVEESRCRDAEQVKGG
jgi:hypothetical protein